MILRIDKLVFEEDLKLQNFLLASSFVLFILFLGLTMLINRQIDLHVKFTNLLLNNSNVWQLVQANYNWLIFVEEDLHIILYVFVPAITGCLSYTVNFYMELVVKVVYSKHMLLPVFEETTLALLAVS